MTMKQFNVKLKKELTYSVIVYAPDKLKAEDEAIVIVEENGEPPINLHAEAEVIEVIEIIDEVIEVDED